jgi:hypothetical protein
MAIGGKERVSSGRYFVTGYKPPEDVSREADSGMGNAINLGTRNDPDGIEALAGTLISEGHRLIAQGNSLRELAVQLREARK